MQTDYPDKQDSSQSVVDLLHRLSSADAGPAWAQFLDAYSALIMKTASQFEYGRGRNTDCYLYVCEQLNDDGFRRLLKFNTKGKANFRTWLGAVVFNLCVDWHRREFGRVTLLPAISALPAFDRAVYRLVIEQNMSKEAAFQTLRADFPDLTRDLIARSVVRVYSLLTPQQRWRISARNRRRQLARGDSLNARLDYLPDSAAGPEAQTQTQQELETLQKAIACLPARQRLLLRLRFQEGVSLGTIAELTKLGDTNRAWRHLQAALKALFQQLHAKKPEKMRKS